MCLRCYVYEHNLEHNIDLTMMKANDLHTVGICPIIPSASK